METWHEWRSLCHPRYPTFFPLSLIFQHSTFKPLESRVPEVFTFVAVGERGFRVRHRIISARIHYAFLGKLTRTRSIENEVVESTVVTLAPH